MDGTLTHAIHDFDEIRESLKLPPSIPILEAIAALPADQAAHITNQLNALEMDIAEQATAQPGAEDLLTRLNAHGASIGIVTRNGREIARATLAACGLDQFFLDSHIVSRDCCTPKPDPAGVKLLLDRWSASATTGVMVGDYLFDLQAGRDAGVTTVHFDVEGRFAWPDITDYSVTSLQKLLALFSE